MPINVRHEPRKEVIIHELIKYPSREELVRYLTFGLPGPYPSLKWVNGVVFTFNSMIHTDTISKEIIDGKLHWDSCFFASMPEYDREIVIDNNAISINVIDVSANETFRAIGEFLHGELVDQ